MRKNTLLFSLISTLLTLCTPASAQRNMMDSLLLRLQEFSKQTGVKVERIEKTHDYVDLGLSVMWATCNVGADKPEEYGDYYAWGETEPKDSYTWENYRFRTSGNDESNVRFSKYADNTNRLDLEDDVAHVKWGGSWRLPTAQEMNELIDSCTWTWTTVNGVNGCLVTSKRPGYTDRSIFLPATGKYGFDTDNKSAGTWGHYWSSSVNKDQSSYNAGVLAIGSGYAAVKITFRAHGQSVRPVRP